MCEHGLKRVACRPCHLQAARDRQAEHRRLKPTTSEENRRKALRTKYGLTVEAWDALFTAQGGRCAICNLPPTGRRETLHVDHCHDGGKVRGLLCTSCNVMLGMAKDVPDTLLAGAAYLQKHEMVPRTYEVAKVLP